MAKRNLTKQQLHRIRKVQDERVERANKRDKKVDTAIASGSLGVEVQGLVIAHYGVTLDVEDDKGNRVRCHKRSSLPALVTGDQVIWRQDSAETGIIVALQDRRSLLNRPDVRGALKPVAANIDQILIVISPSPETPVNLIDRYLVAAHASDIEPIILLNKSDLLTADHVLSEYLAQYAELGYKTVTCSAELSNGMEEIVALMANKVSVFVGQSGVGKSSIINMLLPEVQTKTAEISESTGKGRHTTTTAVLYHIPSGGQLIDSPGIREFGLWHVDSQQLYFGYPEFEHSQGCKFRDCKHENEPGCGILVAVQDGLILQRRYQSYIAIRDSLDEVTMRGNDL